MVLSDGLVEEIYQTLMKLPMAAVESLIAKMRAEVEMQRKPPVAPLSGLAGRPAQSNTPDEDLTKALGAAIGHYG